MLGFDYIGLNGGKKANNIYAGTSTAKGAHETSNILRKLAKTNRNYH